MHGIRIELARLGWNTSDKLDDFGWRKGNRGYMAWVYRWDWHGVRLGSRVSFGLSIKPEILSPERIDELWEKLRDIALAAWRDFPESFPYQTSIGVIEDVNLTGIVSDVHGGNPWKKNQQPRTAGEGE